MNRDSGLLFWATLYTARRHRSTNLKKSHDADDAEEFQHVVLLLEVGEDEVEVEGHGGNEVDDVDRFADERQFVGTDDEAND